MSAGRRQLACAVGAVALAHGLMIGSGAALASTPARSPGAGSETTTQPAPATQPTPTTQPSTPQPPARVVLSNERTVTVWAHPVEEVGIRARPLDSARTIARTRLATEDGYPEVYLLLSTLTDAHGRVWVQMRIPGRPNGRIGWVPQEALGEFQVSHWLIEIRLGQRRLTAYDKGKLRRSAPVGIGKPSSPTPPGHFWIRERFKISSRSNPYWPYAFGTSDYSTLTDWPGGGVVGIHGDFGQPQLIPGDPSHGCVRMHSRDIAWLGAHVPVGTPVHIVR
jgi:L,D-transpeptidase catalytic domain